MPMTIYKLAASAAGSSVASLDIQLDGNIQAILMSGMCSGMNALDEGLQAEVSFLSTPSFAINDTRGSLMTIQVRMGLLTSGGCPAFTNMSVSSLNVPVAQGERIHLHISDLGGALTARDVTAYLYVEDKGTPRIPGRRR